MKFKHIANVFYLLLVLAIIFLAFVIGNKIIPFNNFHWNVFSYNRTVDVSVNSSIPNAVYYIANSTVTIVPKGKYSVNVDNHMVDVTDNITINGFYGKIILNDSFDMQGKFSSLTSHGMTIKSGKINGIAGLDYQSIISKCEGTFLFNDTDGILDVRDGSFSMKKKFVKLNDFLGIMKLSNGRVLMDGKCLSVEIRGKNKITVE